MRNLLNQEVSELLTFDSPQAVAYLYDLTTLTCLSYKRLELYQIAF